MTKFSELKSIGHNIADSLASGIGLPIGVYMMDVFAEAADSQEGFIIADFLTGKSSGGCASESLAHAIALYKDAFTDLCEKHGTTPAAFKEVTAKYSIDSHGPRFVVTVEDNAGHRSVDEYTGFSGSRVKVLDELGRIRPKKSKNND